MYIVSLLILVCVVILVVIGVLALVSPFFLSKENYFLNKSSRLDSEGLDKEMQK